MQNITTLEQLAAYINARTDNWINDIHDIIDSNGWDRSEFDCFEVCNDGNGNRVEINQTGGRIARVIYGGADLSIEGKIRVICNDLRIDHRISRNRYHASMRMQTGTEVYQAEELRRDEAGWARELLTINPTEQAQEERAAFHTMITGGTLMPHWSRTTVDGVEYLIHYA